MRFLMLNWRDPKNPRAGGAERVSLAYLAALRERGHEAYWFANSFPGGGAHEEIRGVKIFRGGGFVTSILAARRWYPRQPPFDLVIDQHHGIPWYAPWWSRTNCVAYIHEVLGPIWNAFYPWPVSALGRWQERWTHWLYRRVPFWTASACTRDHLFKHGVQSVKIIPYGVETTALPSLDDKPLKRPLSLAAVARLAPNKRIDHSILAMKFLTEKGIPAHLTIVGGGESLEALRALVKNLNLSDRVSFAGVLPEHEKDSILKKSHFLLHTSLREGWGLNVIEANAMGTPAAVYPVAGLIESTLHDQTGIVTANETPESLAQSLIAILETPDKYQQYRVKAWDRAKTLHWSNVLPGACQWLEAQANRSKIRN